MRKVKICRKRIRIFGEQIEFRKEIKDDGIEKIKSIEEIKKIKPLKEFFFFLSLEESHGKKKRKK